ncbi:mechanosensitive ion channel family protein [Okeania sp. SIO2B3]|uniref:mechanosensitive ion channel family protein n=1 Tax=Okeania sp. SIO2B3 TaxID=2607784 RepID=UPI0013BEC2B7|nr:mechanosensitive ion channel family protein [Okeania sp. SIO2B3]NET44313.1 mechanosensitive ion channel family protein [Okeania sp. SIO2B3]
MLKVLQVLDSPSINFLLLIKNELSNFLGDLLIWTILAFILYIVVFYGTRSLFRRLNNEIGILTLNILQTPLPIIFILIFLKIAISNLESLEYLAIIQRLLTAAIILISTYLVSALFTQVVSYYLSQYAEKTEAEWDDVLVPIVKNTLPIIIFLIGSFLFLQTLGIDLTGLWVGFGGVTFVLGFALKDILSNFFSGLVLLIDTPFQFGDVVALKDGSTAVIKSVGIRLTTLYLIESHCDLFLPNAALESEKLINFSRPNPNYYYTITLPIRGDCDPNQAIKIIEEVVLSHPDTLGDLDKKLVAIENFYRVSDRLLDAQDNLLSKKEFGHKRLIAEQKLKIKLAEIKQAMKDLISKIQFLEKEGLDGGEIREIQGYYLDILIKVGFKVISEKPRGKKLLYLKESENMDEDTLISLLRSWYENWQEDPDIIEEDNEVLKVEFDRKIAFLKMRMDKFLQQIVNANNSFLETKLDDYGEELWKWMEDRFQIYAAWQHPKIWMNNVTIGRSGEGTIDLAVKFFIDNVKLEQCQRGNRIRSEVHGEIVRRLRQAYFYR